MPAINPRRPYPCQAAPLVTGRFQEDEVGQGPFKGLLVAGILIGAAHLFAGSWGWAGWLALGALDVSWLLILWLFTDEVRLQRRHGLGYVELDARTLVPGGTLGLRIGSDRGLRGLRGITAWLRCVDTFQEVRDLGEGDTESVDACYVVWEEHQKVDASALPASREARVDFALPLETDLVGPWGTWKARAWQVEVERHGGPLPLRFFVMVKDVEWSTGFRSGRDGRRE